jgi:hypothetical protein
LFQSEEFRITPHDFTSLTGTSQAVLFASFHMLHLPDGYIADAVTAANHEKAEAIVSVQLPVPARHIQEPALRDQPIKKRK